MKEQKNLNHILARVILLCAGLSVMAIGVAFSIKAALGTSPISSVPFVTGTISGLSVGTTTVIMNCIFVLIQILILRKRFEWFQLLQIPASFLFGVMIDVGGVVLQGIPCDNYLEQWILCILGIVLLAFGVSMEITARLITNAGEGVVLAVCKVLPVKFGDMKVVFVNRVPEDTSVLTAGSSAAVVSDENQSGGYQGQFLADYFNAKGQTDVRYIMLQGTLGLVHTEQRSASVIQAMKDGGLNPIEAAAPLVADYDRATAMDMISPLLGTTEFDCIIANNDAMALGAVEALQAQGMDPTSIPIVGIDATVDGIQAIKDGTLAMTVFQDANGQGYGAVQAAVNLIEGNAINDGTDYETDETGNIVWVPFEPVTPENVADYE